MPTSVKATKDIIQLFSWTKCVSMMQLKCSSDGQTAPEAPPPPHVSDGGSDSVWTSLKLFFCVFFLCVCVCTKECQNCAPLSPYLNDYRILLLLKTGDFSRCIVATTTNMFAFPGGRTKHTLALKRVPCKEVGGNSRVKCGGMPLWRAKLDQFLETTD